MAFSPPSRSLIYASISASLRGSVARFFSEATLLCVSRVSRRSTAIANDRARHHGSQGYGRSLPRYRSISGGTRFPLPIIGTRSARIFNCVDATGSHIRKYLVNNSILLFSADFFTAKSCRFGRRVHQWARSVREIGKKFIRFWSLF